MVNVRQLFRLWEGTKLLTLKLIVNFPLAGAVVLLIGLVPICKLGRG